jgi:hypothetical protein
VQPIEEYLQKTHKSELWQIICCKNTDFSYQITKILKHKTTVILGGFLLI